jgi:hypothetical protein
MKRNLSRPRALARQEVPMSIYSVGVINGSSKAALQAALGNGQGHRHVAFATDEGSFEANLDACEDLGGNAPGVVIRGHITSGPYRGRSFIGTYDPTTHKGNLNLSVAL